MFLPENLNADGTSTTEAERKAAFKRIEEWALQLIPEPIRGDVQVSIQEVQCGDPECGMFLVQVHNLPMLFLFFTFD